MTNSTPAAQCEIEDWIARLLEAGHTVTYFETFVGYRAIYEAIAASDAVLGLVTSADGTQWAVELSAAVGHITSLDGELNYEGEMKPTYLQWVGDGVAFSYFDALIEHGANPLPHDHDTAVSDLLNALEAR